MIRPARPGDLPALLGLARAFHEEARPPWSWHAPTIERTLATAMQAPTGAVFVAEAGGTLVGGLIGLLVPSPFDGLIETHELALFVAQDARGRWGPRLIDALQSWGAGHGARRSVLQDVGGRAGALYARKGLARVAEVWIG